MTKWSREITDEIIRWLQSRKSYLTASDFKELAPLYRGLKESEAKAATDKRYKPESKRADLRKKIEAIWLNKKRLTIDTFETEAMRRGHCLEPEAVDVYCNNTGEVFYHWDDALLYKPGTNLAASPDALDLKQPEDIVTGDVSKFKPLHALEVKCFNTENHWRNYRADDKMKIDEDILFQIAWQLYVMELEDVTVVFFNPDLPEFAVKTYSYTGEDLKEYIDLIPDVVNYYNEYTAELEYTIPTTEFKLNAFEPELAEQFEV